MPASVLDHINLIEKTKAGTFSIKNFHALLASMREELVLPTNYRRGTSESVVYSLMPNGEGLAWGRRFFDLNRLDSGLDMLCEAVAIVSETHSEEDSINIIKAFFLKEPVMCSQPFVLNLLLYAAKKPEIFMRDVSAAVQKVMQIKFMPNHFSKTKQKYFSGESSELLVPAAAGVSQIEMHDIPEKYQTSLSLVCTVNPRASEINGRLDNLFAIFKEKVVANESSSFELASLLHTGIIKIHPYFDGNGKVARGLMNHILKQSNIGPFDPKVNPEMEHKYDSYAALNDESQFAQWIKTQAQTQQQQKQRHQRKLFIKQNPKSAEAKNAFELCKAARDNNIERIQELISANPGVDLSMPSLKNYTPLHYACHTGAYSAVRLLLGKGADPLMTNDGGKTTFDLIKDASIKSELKEFWGNIKVVSKTDHCVALSSSQSPAASSSTQGEPAEEPTKKRTEEIAVSSNDFLIASTQEGLAASDESKPKPSLKVVKP